MSTREESVNLKTDVLQITISWGCSSMLEHLPRMLETLGLNPSTAETSKKSTAAPEWLKLKDKVLDRRGQFWNCQTLLVGVLNEVTALENNEVVYFEVKSMLLFWSECLYPCAAHFCVEILTPKAVVLGCEADGGG